MVSGSAARMALLTPLTQAWAQAKSLTPLTGVCVPQPLLPTASEATLDGHKTFFLSDPRPIPHWDTLFQEAHLGLFESMTLLATHYDTSNWKHFAVTKGILLSP